MRVLLDHPQAIESLNNTEFIGPLSNPQVQDAASDNRAAWTHGGLCHDPTGAVSMYPQGLHA